METGTHAENTSRRTPQNAYPQPPPPPPPPPPPASPKSSPARDSSPHFSIGDRLWRQRRYPLRRSTPKYFDLSVFAYGLYAYVPELSTAKRKVWVGVFFRQLSQRDTNLLCSLKKVLIWNGYKGQFRCLTACGQIHVNLLAFLFFAETPTDSCVNDSHVSCLPTLSLFAQEEDSSHRPSQCMSHNSDWVEQKQRSPTRSSWRSGSQRIKGRVGGG